MSKAKKQKNGNKHRALSAQQTIPYIAMHPDGICQLPGGLYTKTLEYEDINYAVASTEDQTAIISGWSACLNYFDSSLPFQLSFVNRRSRNANRYKVNIPAQEDDFNSIRGEYVEMLKGQIAKSNNGIERYKYITFGLPAEGATEARPRLGRVEADVMGNLKRLGVQSRPLDGRDRLAVLHGQMHPGGREPFRFAWKDIPKTGMGTKDYIAPDSFDFRQSRTFRVGQMWGAASYLQIMASELSDKLLAEILELDAELTVTMHIQTVDQLKAIKTIKGKISDIGRMKAEEQKKAVRAGYDMEILPPDLITFSKDAAELLSDLQSRNERMFLLTFLIVNTAPTRERLENDIFTVNGIAQKYNCAVKRLDWQQEQGYMSSLALGYNGIEIQRGMTTSSTAIFVPFMTRELRMDGPSLYYGMNALSHNVIMADRKKLKSANGLYLGSTGSGKSVLLKLLLMQALRKGAEVYIADFKGGVDFPKVWHEKCRMCFAEEDLCNILDRLVEELERRKSAFKALGCPNIDAYNEIAEHPLQRLIFACDEVAEMLDKTGADNERKKLLSQIESMLSTIARQGRAFGIHLILATQRPDATIIPGQIRNNMDFRVCGRADSVLSQIILDNTGAAEQIPKDARGRFITGDGTVFQGYLFDEGQL